MIRKILHTLSTRSLALLAGFLFVWITARFFGPEIRGQISLFIFSLAIVAAVANIVGGPVLVYRSSRHHQKFLLKYAIIWSILSGIIVPFVLFGSSLIGTTMLYQLIIPGILLSFINSYSGILLGQDKIAGANRLALLQALLLPALISILILFGTSKGYQLFIVSLYVTYLITCVPGLIYLLRINKEQDPYDEKPKAILPIMMQGLKIQAASLFQLISYRAAFWFISLAGAGIFSVAAALSEAVWVISKSLATLQYSQISASRDQQYQRKLTRLFLFISASGTAALLILLLLIPKTLIVSVFGIDYSEVAEILPWLAPGIFFMSIATIYTHHFSGIGKNTINIIASFTGAAIALLACWFLEDDFGLKGVAMGTSAGYLFNMLALWIVYTFESRKVNSLGNENSIRA